MRWLIALLDRISGKSYSELYSKHMKLKHYTQKLEDMLANRNATTITNQSLTVTNHAVFRARERLKFKGTDDDIRRRIYKLAVRNLAVMDKLTDGEYTLDRNTCCRIKDNTITTVMRRRGK